VTGWVNWPLRLWGFTQYHQFIGRAGAEGVGYHAPASVGAALANKKHGRISINFQQDGDLMMGPGVLWTAAHHKIPLLTLMHNNRGFHQEVMEVQRMALEHGRSATRANIGTKFDAPFIDYTKLAKGREGLEAWRGGIVWVADELRDLAQRLNVDPATGTVS